MISVSICVWWLDLNGFRLFMPTDGADDTMMIMRCAMLVTTMTMRMMMVPMMTTTMTRRGGVPCWGLRVVLFCARQRWAAMSARDPVSSLGAQVVQTILLHCTLVYTSYSYIVTKNGQSYFCRSGTLKLSQGPQPTCSRNNWGRLPALLKLLLPVWWENAQQGGAPGVSKEQYGGGGQNTNGPQQPRDQVYDMASLFWGWGSTSLFDDGCSWWCLFEGWWCWLTLLQGYQGGRPGGVGPSGAGGPGGPGGDKHN